MVRHRVRMVARRREHERHVRLTLALQDRPHLVPELAIRDPGDDPLVDLEAVLVVRVLEAVARVELVHVPEVRHRADGRERAVPALGQQRRQAAVMVARVPRRDHPDRQRIQRLHHRELGVRRRSEVGRLVVVREVEALARQGRQARRDRLAVHLQADHERLRRLRADDDQVLPLRHPEQLRGRGCRRGAALQEGADTGQIGVADRARPPDQAEEQVGDVIRQQADRGGDLQADRRVAEDALRLGGCQAGRRQRQQQGQRERRQADAHPTRQAHGRHAPAPAGIEQQPHQARSGDRRRRADRSDRGGSGCCPRPSAASTSGPAPRPTSRRRRSARGSGRRPPAR